MVEHRVLEYLFYVLLGDLGWGFAWGPQVLSSIDGQVDLCIAKVLGLVVGEQ